MEAGILKGVPSTNPLIKMTRLLFKWKLDF